MFVTKVVKANIIAFKKTKKFETRFVSEKCEVKNVRCTLYCISNNTTYAAFSASSASYWTSNDPLNQGRYEAGQLPVEFLPLAYSGLLWHTLAYSGILWHTLAYSGIFWHTLAYFGLLFHTLVYFGILMHILAYSG